MSASCIVNLKKHDLSFLELNHLANSMVDYALKQQIGVFFNARDYGYEIIKDGGMKDYFLISDSFLYKNCDFLEEPLNQLEKNTISETHDAFCNRYYFLQEIVEKIFCYKVFQIEIYISTDGSINSAKDFSLIKTDRYGFLEDLWQSIFDSKRNILIEFPTEMFLIENK